MRNIKLFVAIIVLLFTVCNVMQVSASTFIGLSNFEHDSTYTDTTFTDINKDSWYVENVRTVYEYGLMSGKGNSIFDPSGNISVAEAITVAVRINCIYTMGNIPAFDTYDDDLWYSPYLRYAQEFAIVDKEYSNYNAPATRAEFAKILATSVDPIDLEAINIVDDGAIPDVDMSADYAEAVYLLYRAGVLSGSDANGTFNPDSTITRAEAAAIITRIIDPSLRKSIELVGEY